MIKIKYGSFKDCALRVPYTPPSIVAKVTDNNKTFYFGCVSGDDSYQISGILAKALGFDQERPVLIEFVPGKLCTKIEVEPSDEDSWDLISYNTDFIELNLLAQIKVVQTGLLVPLWIHSSLIWLKVLQVEGGWGLLQRNSEVLVKPKERVQKGSSFKELRAVNGGLSMITNEFLDDSVLACVKDQCVILGLSKKGKIRENHIASALLEKFSYYKVFQILPIIENTVCFINKHASDIKTSPAQFTLSCSYPEWLEILNSYQRILIYDGMKFVVNNKEVSVTISTQVNTHEWLGFILITNPKLVTCSPPAAEVKALPYIIPLFSLQKFCSTIATELETNKVVIIEGAPGIGKTCSSLIISELLEKEYIATVFVRCRSFTKKEFCSKLSEAIEAGNKKSPCVLIIDDLDSCCAKTEDNESVESRLSSCQSSVALLSCLDTASKNLSFLLICKHRTCLNSVLATSAYTTSIFAIPALTAKDISEVLFHHFPEIPPGPLVSSFNSYTLTDLINFCKLAKLQLFNKQPSTASIFELKKSFIPQALEKTENPSSALWENIGGMFSAKEKVLDAFSFPIKYSSLYENYPLKLRSGMLIFGPPGCGKTLMASSIPSICEMAMICVKGPELLNKYIGASEQSVREVFERAKRVKPCAIVFDEFEAIVPKRGSGSTAVTDRIVNQFLCELDGVEARTSVYVIAVSSRPELIDPALLRPGRLDFHVFCDFPQIDERKHIFEVLCRKIGIQLNLDQAAQETSKFTPADIQGLMNNLQIKLAHKSFDAINEERISDEIKNFQPSFNDTQIKTYKDQYHRFMNKKTAGIGEKQALV